MTQIIEPTIRRNPADLSAGERASKLLRQGSKHLNVVKIAKGQRTILYVILLQIICYFSLMLSSFVSSQLRIPLFILYAIVLIIGIVFTIRLAIACGYHVAIIIIACIFMLVPFINLLLLLSINSRATMLLKLTGIRVGLMGVSNTEMQKLYEGSCMNCGYSLHGINGIVCPECGNSL